MKYYISSEVEVVFLLLSLIKILTTYTVDQNNLLNFTKEVVFIINYLLTLQVTRLLWVCQVAMSKCMLIEWFNEPLAFKHL